MNLPRNPYVLGAGAVVALGVLAVWWWKRGDTNPIYGAVNGLGASVTGDKNWNLGARIWELLHPGQTAADNDVTKPVPPKTKPKPARIPDPVVKPPVGSGQSNPPLEDRPEPFLL